MKNSNKPLSKARRGNAKNLDMGGQVFLDRDYSEVFKGRSSKQVFIALCIFPFTVILPLILWSAGLKVFAIVIWLAALSIFGLVSVASRIE